MSMFWQFSRAAKCQQCDQLGQEVRRLNAENSALNGTIATLKERNVELRKSKEKLQYKNSQLNAKHAALQETLDKVNTEPSVSIEISVKGAN